MKCTLGMYTCQAEIRSQPCRSCDRPFVPDSALLIYYVCYLFEEVIDMSPMDPARIRALGHSYPISYLAVFGSYARGDQTANSDLDLLVWFSKKVSLFDLVRIEREMSSRLGVQVDLVTQGAMSPHIRPHITRDLQVLIDD